MVIYANSLFWRLTKRDGETAIAMLKRAVERYPDYAPAYSMLALMLLVSGYAAWALSELEPQVRQAEALAARAVELARRQRSLGAFSARVRRFHAPSHRGGGVEQFQRAIDLNPNFAAAHGYFGWALALDGQSDRAIPHLEEAIRISPNDPQNAIFYVELPPPITLRAATPKRSATGARPCNSGPHLPGAIAFIVQA